MRYSATCIFPRSEARWRYVQGMPGSRTAAISEDFVGAPSPGATATRLLSRIRPSVLCISVDALPTFCKRSTTAPRASIASQGSPHVEIANIQVRSEKVMLEGIEGGNNPVNLSTFYVYTLRTPVQLYRAMFDWVRSLHGPVLPVRKWSSLCSSPLRSPLPARCPNSAPSRTAH